MGLFAPGRKVNQIRDIYVLRVPVFAYSDYFGSKKVDLILGNTIY